MGFELTVWPAPFSGHGSASYTTPEELEARTGDLVMIRCAEPIAEGSGPALVELVRRCRHRFPGSPAAVWITDANPEHVIELVRAATSAQVRAILGGDALCADHLRKQLTNPEGIGQFVLRWAADAGYLPAGRIHEELGTLLEAAPNVRTLERLARQRHVASRTWRGKLQQMGLPTPHAWLGLAHALHVAFFVQRNAARPLQALSEELGMQNVAIMGHQFRRVFGIPPGQVRDLLGAEPLLHRWFQGQRRDPR